MVKPEFLYHGSSILVDVLKPHQAYDWDNERGRMFGVYATSNRDVATAFALGAVPDESGSISRMIRKQDSEPIKMVFVYGSTRAKVNNWRNKSFIHFWFLFIKINNKSLYEFSLKNAYGNHLISKYKMGFRKKWLYENKCDE